MSLRERVRDLEQRYGIQLATATLRKYYKARQIRFMTVDLALTAKIRAAEQTRKAQKEFVYKLLAAQASKYIYYLDETSITLWNNIKRRTWTDGASVVLPMQSSRGRNCTVIGAIGGQDEK